ncbi:MFS transporter [Salinifilum aidingensis]
MVEPTTTAPSRTERRARWAVTGYFVVTGVALATWTSRIPAIAGDLALDEAGVTVALFALAAGSVVAMQGVGRLADRFGSARVLGPAGVLLAGSVLLPGIAPNLPALVGAVALFGIGHGTVDVAMNSHALRVQHRYGRPILTTFHALFSIGGLLGAGFGALAARSGVPVAPHFLTAAAVLAAVVLLSRRFLLPAEDGPAAEAPGAEPAPARARVPTIIVLLGALGFCCTLGEGAMADWSPLYLTEVVHAGPAVAATGYAVFSAAMAVFRFLGDGLVQRFGAVALVRACGLVAGCGLAMTLLVRDPWVALAGFALFGAGLSCIVPQVFNAAGNRDRQRSGRDLAQVATFGYAGLLAGPVVIGLVAQAFGLTAGLAVPAALAVLIALAADAVRPPRPA